MNQLLEKTRQALLQKADPRLKKPIEQTVEAGKQIMYSAKTRELVIEQLRQAQDPESVGAGIAKLIGILFSRSPKGLPMQVLIPAAMLLLCEALQFLEEAGAVRVDAKFLSDCTSAAGSAILQMFKASPEQLQAFVNNGQGAPAATPAGAPTPASAGIVGGAMGGAR